MKNVHIQLLLDIGVIKMSIKKTFNVFNSKYSNIPINFNWYDNETFGNENLARIKRNISNIKNQHGLGVCWAVASSTAMSDAFVISQVIDWNPSLSTTYILSNFDYPGTCQGGLPNVFYSESIILKKHVLSDSCIDYSWCSGDKNCNTIDDDLTTKEFATNLPTKGCYDPFKTRLAYYVDDFYNIGVDEFQKEIKNYQIVNTTIKRHVLACSTVPIAVPLFENFFENFWLNENTKGIYFENENPVFVGGHVLVIVGWGEEIIDDKIVNYWWCRNSWGDSWALNGLCKIACYPFNKYTQVEHLDYINVYRSLNDGKKEKSVISPMCCFVFVNQKPKTVGNLQTAYLKNDFYLNLHPRNFTTDETELVLKKGGKIFEQKKNCFEEKEKCELASKVFPENYFEKYMEYSFVDNSNITKSNEIVFMDWDNIDDRVNEYLEMEVDEKDDIEYMDVG